MKYYSDIKKELSPFYGYTLQCEGISNTSCQVKEASHKRLCTVWFHLHKVSRTGKFTETYSRLVVARDWKNWDEMWSACQGVWSFSLGWWKGSKLDRSDGCTTPNILKSTELLKRGGKKSHSHPRSLREDWHASDAFRLEPPVERQKKHSWRPAKRTGISGGYEFLKRKAKRGWHFAKDAAAKDSNACQAYIYIHSVVRLKSVMSGNSNLPKNKKCNCSLPTSLQLCCGL